jgi:hypothetical protein
VEEAFQFLSSVELHLKSEIVEDAYHLKTARLTDIGFVDSVEASRIYRNPVDDLKKSFQVLGTSRAKEDRPAIFNASNLPAPLAKSLKNADLVVEILSGIEDSGARDIFLQDLVFVANRVVSVWAGFFSNGAHLEHAAQQVMVNLSHGISNLKNEGWKNSEIAQIPPSQLFSFGYQQIVGLKKKWLKVKSHDHLVAYQKMGIDLWPENLKKVGSHLNRPIPSLTEFSPETSIPTLIEALELFTEKLDFLKNRGYHYLSLSRDLVFSETNQSRESVNIDTLAMTLLGNLLLFGEKSVPNILTTNDLVHLLKQKEAVFALDGVGEKLSHWWQTKMRQMIHELKLQPELDPRYVGEVWLWL